MLQQMFVNMGIRRERRHTHTQTIPQLVTCMMQEAELSFLKDGVLGGGLETSDLIQGTSCLHYGVKAPPLLPLAPRQPQLLSAKMIDEGRPHLLFPVQMGLSNLQCAIS